MRTYMSGLFMIVFLCAAGVMALAATWQNRETAAIESPEKLLAGEWALNYEKSFNKKVFMYDLAIGSWGLLNYVAFQEGSDGVLIGENDWLFTKEEFDYRPGYDKQIAEKLNFITAVRDQMAARNIELLIVPVPAKARVYKDYLGRYNLPGYREKVYGVFMQGLRQRDIPAVDTYMAMQAQSDKNLYLKTDTHWSPAGAEIAAKASAAYLQKHMPQVKYERSVFQTLVRSRKKHEGDLLRYVPTAPAKTNIGPAPESIEVVETVEKSSGDQDLASALFDEGAPPVTLVGTSYSANPAWNFDGYLKQYLKTDILNAADEGLGPFETMKKYMKDEAFIKTPPRLVIWEIPERYLPVEYDLKAEFYKREEV